MALEKAIAKYNQTIDFSNPGNETTNNETPSNNDITPNANDTTNTTPSNTNNTTTSNGGNTANNGNTSKNGNTANDGSATNSGNVNNISNTPSNNGTTSNTPTNNNNNTPYSNTIYSNGGTPIATFKKMESVSSTDTGIVSGSDLYTEVRPTDGTYIKNNATTAANLKSLDEAIVSAGKATDTLIKKDGDTIQIGGGDTTQNVTIINIAKSDDTPRTLTGIADGVNDYDAVNMRQYNALSTDVRAVAAGSAALAALHPGTYNPDDKMSFAVGFGHYKDANAGALGAFYKPNEDTMISVAGTVGNGNPMWNLGLSFKLGERGIKAKTYRDGKELTRDMNSLQKDSAEQAAKIKTLEADKNLCAKKNDAQDKKIAAQEKMINLQAKKIEAQEKKIASLEVQVAQIMKKVELSSTVKKTAAAH